MKARVVFGLLFAGLVAARLCHVDILWPEETLPMATAVEMLHGKTIYRDVWFDKPPLAPAFYLLWGAFPGLPLRVAGAAYILLACWLLWRFATEMWGPREGWLAGGLAAFFLTFWLPAAVLPLASDLLMLVPHIAAVFLAWRGRPLASGLVAGVAFLFSSKGLFVLAACAIWQYRALPQLLAGFAAPNLVVLGWLGIEGALRDYWEQVWRLGFRYAGDTFLEDPIRTGLQRTANWLGFHAALVAGAAWFWRKDRGGEGWRLAAWALLSLAAVTAGWRFFPRYYFQLLPVAVMAGARGLALLQTSGQPLPDGRGSVSAGRLSHVVLALLLIPLVRFGPRYVVLAGDLLRGQPSAWSDTAMDRDSRRAAALILAVAHPEDTLFVWGYRPEIYVYTRLPAASRFLESQPLTGVFADRHLFDSTLSFPEWTRANRAALVRSRPRFLLDGLSPYNPRLSVGAFKDLQGWFSQYEPAGRTRFSILYRRIDP